MSNDAFCAMAAGVCTVALLLSGCAQPTPPQTAAAAPSTASTPAVSVAPRVGRLEGARAATCTLDLANQNSFTYRISRMLVANDGGWCTVTDWYYQGSERFRLFPPTRIDLTAAPAHGEVRIRREDIAYVDYKPAPGFKGTDRFEYYSEPVRTTNAIEVTVE